MLGLGVNPEPNPKLEERKIDDDGFQKVESKKSSKEAVAQEREEKTESSNRFSEISEREELASVQQSIHASNSNSFSLSVTDCVKAHRRQDSTSCRRRRQKEDVDKIISDQKKEVKKQQLERQVRERDTMEQYQQSSQVILRLQIHR